MLNLCISYGLLPAVPDAVSLSSSSLLFPVGTAYQFVTLTALAESAGQDMTFTPSGSQFSAWQGGSVQVHVAAAACGRGSDARMRCR